MKSPAETSLEEYQALGFKCGLEVHQQLKTAHKLFCRCPNTKYSQAYDAEILRHMRPTLSELGEYDGTALMEFKTRKEIVYRIARDTVCTYEMDDTPPFMINEEALDIALEIAVLLNCKLVSEMHVSRKQYLDGSIPTGFQRTTILGIDGWIPFKGRKVRIRQLALEEDACREVSDVGHVRTYLTDRLSIPLVEMVTETDIACPREAAEVAQVLRLLTRSTGKVRTGMGAARQDLNVSIKGGTRVEIKGVPRIPMLPVLSHYEALRQKALLEIRDLLKQRGVDAKLIGTSYYDVTGVVKRAHFAPVQKAVASGQSVLAVRLPRFRNVLNTEIGPGVRFAREFEGRVRVIACLDQMPNIAWSDNPEPTLALRLWERVTRFVGAGPEDVVVLVWGNQRDARTAAQEVLLRAAEAAEGVPAETRKALRDGTTTFERILPGPNRMYPDTDHPPVAITDERIARIRAGMVPPPWEVIERYRNAGVPEHLAKQMILDPRRKLFETLLQVPLANPLRAAVLVSQTIKGLARKSVHVDSIPEATLVRLFELFCAGRFHREAFPALLTYLAESPSATAEEAVQTLVNHIPKKDGIETRVRELLQNVGWRRGDSRKEHLIAMGEVMRHLRGSIPGAEVARVVRKVICEEHH